MTTQPPDFRALCAELVEAIDRLLSQGESPANPGSRLILTVHVEDLGPLAEDARAALNAPPLAPIPASERLPGPEDCDDQGRCWWLTVAATEGGAGGYLTYWSLATHRESVRSSRHWLPHWAIPLPEVKE
jgi:hypothetical protein